MPDIVRTLTLVTASWAIESAMIRLIMRDRFRWQSLIDLFWINLLTNPAANYAYGELGWNWWFVESAVAIAEIWPIGRSLRVSIPQAIGLSILANGTSAIAGRVVEILNS
ncbi:hypothetical protein GC170_01515 [bacterium]|nr:hypothetical protein [bacterium]